MGKPTHLQERVHTTRSHKHYIHVIQYSLAGQTRS